MIAVDTNILVYAHRRDSPFHKRAFGCLAQLAESRSPWAIPWTCVHEFLSIVTHPRIYDPPTSLKAAIGQVDTWLESPSLVLLTESGQHWPELRACLIASQVTGPRIHDARIAALCQQHGVKELWSADRDFGRFTGLGAINPLTR